MRSTLPLCDEFVIALGKGDAQDTTRDLLMGIDDPRIRILDTEWTDRDRLGGRIYSKQTNIALTECTGDWCFYIQLDEVLHEDFIPAVRRRCEQLLDNRRVEGLVFRERPEMFEFGSLAGFHYTAGHHQKS